MTGWVIYSRRTGAVLALAHLFSEKRLAPFVCAAKQKVKPCPSSFLQRKPRFFV